MQNSEWPDNLTLSFVQISQQINGKLGTNDNNGRQHLPGFFVKTSQGRIQGGPRGPGPPLTTKNEAPAPKFYKTEAPEWQF